MPHGCQIVTVVSNPEPAEGGLSVEAVPCSRLNGFVVKSTQLQ